MPNDIVVNGFVAIISGVVSGVMVGLFMFLLDERRGVRDKRREDYRIAINWDRTEKPPSLRNFDLTGANLSGHKFVGADLESAILERSKIWAGNFSDANLRLASFRKAELVGTEFCAAKAIRADFTNATIKRREEPDYTYVPVFSEADLRRASFRNARMEGVIFQKADLRFVDFHNARISGCDFSSADLRESNWCDIKECSGCNWRGVQADEPGGFPERIWREIQEQNRPTE